MSVKKALEFLRSKPGYIKKSPSFVSNTTGYSVKQCQIARSILVNESKLKKKKKASNVKTQIKKLPLPYLNGNPENILVIGDLHEPFSLIGYLEFCREIQEEEDCGTVIFIGDIIDNHFSSYHETDPDGYSAGEELDRAIDKIAEWYYVFPNATITIGNHDRMAYRKAQTAGVTKRWIRKYSEVLETPNWKFVEYIEIKNVNYNHGEGAKAATKMKNELQSQVQGHHHNEFYINYSVGPSNRIFGVQVGCGVDRKAYAMAYGKNFKKPVIGCVTVKEGKYPRLHPMEI